MTTKDFKEYHVTDNSKSKLVYGIHENVENALNDQLKRCYEYKQETSVYAIKHNNELVKIA